MNALDAGGGHGRYDVATGHVGVASDNSALFDLQPLRIKMKTKSCLHVLEWENVSAYRFFRIGTDRSRTFLGGPLADPHVFGGGRVIFD